MAPQGATPPLPLLNRSEQTASNFTASYSCRSSEIMIDSVGTRNAGIRERARTAMARARFALKLFLARSLLGCQPIKRVWRARHILNRVCSGSQGASHSYPIGCGQVRVLLKSDCRA